MADDLEIGMYVQVDILGDEAEEIGERARYMIEKLAAEALQKFAKASVHYGDAFQDDTGLKGQWCDIYRKIGPLKRALWEGKMLTRESPRTICMDLIGHLLITVDMLDRQRYPALRNVRENHDGG